MTPSSSDNELHRFVFEHALDPVVLLRADGTVVTANRAARDLIPSVERLFASSAPWAPAVRELRSELQAHGRARATLEVPTPRGPRHLELDALTRGGHDAILIRDVTERRALESELRQLRRLEAVGHLTASVVHDFNNLLTPIVCLSGLLERGVASDPRLHEFARDVTAASERAANLVRQVLAFTRRGPSPVERLDVGAVVRELQPLIERVAGAGVELTIAVDGEGAEAALDRDQLEHVLLNLTASARDAMPVGGRLTIATGTVELHAESDGCGPGSYVTVRVIDTGVGMTREVRARMFDEFFTSKDQGTSLGLGAAHRFVTRSGGCVAVHSEPGHGTSVVLYFPRASAPEQPARGSASGIEAATGNECVLVVDDDATVRGAVRAVLEERGYAVREAGSEAEAVGIASERGTRLDLLVVDVVLDRASGQDVARRVRALRDGLRVLYTSGHTARVLERHGLSEDDPRLLRKAFTPSALLRKVREILDAPGDVSPMASETG